MVYDVDANEIEQITKNVHNAKTQIYIPCLKTYKDFLVEKNEFSDSAEVFFEYSAVHKSKGIELKQRKDPVRVFRTYPIQNVLHDAAVDDWQQNKSEALSRTVHLIFAGTEPPLFPSIMSPQLSIFEKALVLKEECKDTVEITLISNDERIEEIKDMAEKESKKEFSDSDFKIINTNDWLMDMFFKKQDAEVTNIFVTLLRYKGKMKIGEQEFIVKES
ncbi:hypothetical protein HYX08_06330 [Candidatus Woesearchaeota archaeon]|nr:hypothetical protein [Candidatus Woesearchaeota archaeon]